MTRHIKKLVYLAAVSLSLFLIDGVYSMISRNLTPITNNHEVIALTPYTDNERSLLEQEQQRELRVENPMIMLTSPQMTTENAEAHVLNIT